MAVVMEFCDLGSLMRAIKKKAFKPHGKWTYHTTYVSEIKLKCILSVVHQELPVQSWTEAGSSGAFSKDLQPTLYKAWNILMNGICL